MSRRFYIPILDGRPVAWDGEQLAYCDDLSYWRGTPHRARVYSTLRTMKEHIEQSKQFRAQQGCNCGRYGWVEVSLAGLRVAGAP